MRQPGWMMTRSPMVEWVMVLLAPIEQSRPMRTAGPITAPAPITVPAPISARGPDHRARIDGRAVVDLGRRMHDGARRNAGDAEQRRRAQRVRVHLARDGGEVAMRLAAAQHDEACRRRRPRSSRPSGRRRRASTSGGRETCAAFDVGEVAGAGHVERRDIGDAVRQVGAGLGCAPVSATISPIVIPDGGSKKRDSLISWSYPAGRNFD